MRLFEIVGPRFYFCTDTKHEIGPVILPGEHAGPLAKEIEAWLEEKRPDDANPRTSSFYLTARPLQSCEFVYLLASSCQVARNHLGWIKLRQDRGPQVNSVTDYYAKHYWAGDECLEELDAGWEYRAAKIKLLRQL